MANASVTAHVNRSTVAAALQQARIQAAEHQAWINAINRAALNLEACPWQFDGEVLSIASATTVGTRYTVRPEGCECKAAQDGRPCWHRAAWRLLLKAAELAQPPTPTCPMCGKPLEGRQYYVGGRGTSTSISARGMAPTMRSKRHSRSFIGRPAARAAGRGE